MALQQHTDRLEVTNENVLDARTNALRSEMHSNNERAQAEIRDLRENYEVTLKGAAIKYETEILRLNEALTKVVAEKAEGEKRHEVEIGGLEEKQKQEVNNLESFLSDNKEYNAELQSQLKEMKGKRSSEKRSVKGEVARAIEKEDEIIHNLKMRLQVVEKEREFYKGELGGRGVGWVEETAPARQLAYETPRGRESRMDKSQMNFSGLSTIAKAHGTQSVKKEARRTWNELQESSKNHIRIVEGILHKHGDEGGRGRMSDRKKTPIKMNRRTVRVTHSLKIAASIVARLYLNGRKNEARMQRTGFAKWMMMVDGRDRRERDKTTFDLSDIANSTNLSLL